MDAAQSLQFGRDRRVIGFEPGLAAAFDLGRVRARVGVQRLAIEGGGRAQLGGRHAGVERLARWVAVAVDHAAADAGANGGGAQLAREGIKLGDVPIGIAARQPRRSELFMQPGKMTAGMREGQHQRGLAPMHRQPSHQTNPGSATPITPASASLRTSRLAASMSG